MRLRSALQATPATLCVHPRVLQTEWRVRRHLTAAIRTIVLVESALLHHKQVMHARETPCACCKIACASRARPDVTRHKEHASPRVLAFRRTAMRARVTLCALSSNVRAGQMRRGATRICHHVKPHVRRFR